MYFHVPCILRTAHLWHFRENSTLQILLANIEFRVPYSQRYLFHAIPDTSHNANPTNPNCNSKGNLNPTNPINPNTMYRCEYGTLNLMFAILLIVVFLLLESVTVQEAKNARNNGTKII